jgi:hypothetical protein
MFGCATVGGPKFEQQKRLVRSEEVSDRFPGEVVIANASWTGENLRVRLERPEMCRDARKESIEERQVTRWESEGVMAEALVGSIFAAGGALALGFAPTADDTDPDGQPGGHLSNQTHLYAWGSLALGIGAITLGHLLWIAGKSADDASAWTSSDVVTPLGEGRPCGRVAVGSGSLFATELAERLDLIRTNADEFEVDVRKYAQKLCMGAHAGPVKLYWATMGSRQAVFVTTYDRTNCVRVVRAREKLQRGLALAATAATAAELAAAVLLFEEGSEWLRLLPASDDEHAGLSENARMLADILADRSDRIVATEVERARRALALDDLASGVDAASSALRVVAAHAKARAKWQEIHAALIARLESAQDARGYFFKVLESDRVTAACIDSARRECPQWLDADLVAATFQPILTRATKEVRAATLALRNARALLERHWKSTNLATMDAAREAAAGASLWCEGGRIALSPLQEACAEAIVAQNEADTLTKDNVGSIATLRAEIKEKERVRQPDHKARSAAVSVGVKWVWSAPAGV